jgi:hypothetical protein
MTSADDMRTVVNGSETAYLTNQMPRDADGYPLQLPYTVGGQSTTVRLYLSNYYSGRYRIDFQGTGTLGGSGVSLVSGKYYIDFDGTGAVGRCIDIETSSASDHIRNMHVYPQAIADVPVKPLFLEKFLTGLQPFHAIRFMDWPRTNGSAQKAWADRITTTSVTQGGAGGVSWDYAIALCNELDADAWVCVPHKATNDYIQQMATLFKNGLESGRKVYLEYSNELWNFGFEQYDWINSNAPGSEGSISSDLAALGGEDNFPKKDAYMMDRVFKIWANVFSGADRSRLVNVATGWQAVSDDSEMVLDYLKNTASGFADSVDALAVGGYFSFSEQDHNTWKSKPSSVSPGTMCDAVYDEMEATSNSWARASGAVAKKYGVELLVYEGGQHFVLDTSREWPYASTEYDAQIHPKMYQLYLRNFDTHVKPNVDCKLFMAYDYMGERKSPYGSWGHLEKLDDVGKDYSTVAPKYQALLDCNTSK